MKKTILLSYAALLISFAAAFFSNAEAGYGAKTTAPPLVLFETAAPPAQNAAPSPAKTPATSSAPVAIAREPESESTLPEVSAAPVQETILVKDGEQVVEMDMSDYLIHVVAAEMPAAFEEEALKAQAVAARTYALYCAKRSHHSDAQVCTDFACCQAWSSDENLKKTWGDNYEANLQRVTLAVEQTRGQYLSYGGEPVFAAFHSSSCGQTEDCGAIWSDVPYLISVESPESEEDVPNYISRQSFSPLDFRDTVLHACPTADFTGDESEWLGEIVLDGSGRVSSAVLGGAELSGTQLRSLFSLRSTAFTLEYSEGSFVFTVTGHGHGVGMSQYGANVMALDGADYTRILAHYYPATVLVG